MFLQTWLGSISSDTLCRTSGLNETVKELLKASEKGDHGQTFKLQYYLINRGDQADFLQRDELDQEIGRPGDAVRFNIIYEDDQMKTFKSEEL